MANKNIDELCACLKNNIAKAYLIENNMLKSATDFILNGYLKMLGVILQQSSEITDAQLTIFKRIILGTESEEGAEDYLRMALEIEAEDYLNFTSEIKDSPIRYRFVLDAIILACVSYKNMEQIQLLAEFAEGLFIEKKELEYLSLVAKAILCMDTSMYADACEIDNINIPSDVFCEYIRLLVPSCIIHNDRMTIFQPSSEKDVTEKEISQISNTDTPTIKLCNVKVDLSKYTLKFSSRSKVIIEGCEFIGGNKYSIEFYDCKSVIIRNTKFMDFAVRTLKVDKVDEMKLYNSSFIRCCMNYTNRYDDWRVLGGVIYVTNKNGASPIIIDGCLFEACGGRNSANYYRSAFISNAVCDVNNSKFINCWHYNNNCIDVNYKSRTMFALGSKATSCTYENSAAFC